MNALSRAQKHEATRPEGAMQVGVINVYVQW